MRRALAAAAAALTAALVAAPMAMADSQAPWTYAVIGDTPYGQPQIDNFANDVAQINADRKVRVVLHLGDIKNGSTRCDTSYFEQIRGLFDQFRDPLFSD